MSDRLKIEPITQAIPEKRQSAARHYGTHPYFTRRPANVIEKYIERFTEPGDLVLDPFGGTGVTAIEALLLGRKAIQNDLNPFANFIAENIADTSMASIDPLKESFVRIEKECKERLEWLERAADKDVEKYLKTLPLPENIPLHKSSDARRFFDLFSSRQLAALATLKASIELESEEIRGALLLAWSAAAAKLNKTFLSAEGRAESRGGSSIFSIYRYKLAKKTVELPLWATFRGRFLNILKAKEEVLHIRDVFNVNPLHKMKIDSRKNFQVLDQDACLLDRTIDLESVDYIYTDPPYGAHIAYLDLSILWNHWLGHKMGKEVRHAEAIVGGSLNLSEEHYKNKLAESLRISASLLKPNRWMTVVFQHWDVSYFSTILNTLAESGAELKSAVTQEPNVIWSMHKKKNSKNVISGELILTFFKSRHLQVRQTSANGTQKNFIQLMEQLLNKDESVTLSTELIFNRLIIESWRQNSLDALTVSREEFCQFLQTKGWTYNDKLHAWHRSSNVCDDQRM